MSDNNVNSHFLSASLFDIAYSIDTAKNEVNAIYWLFNFCAIALIQNGIDPYDAIPDPEDDSEDARGMFKRAEAITSYVEERNTLDQSSAAIPSDEEILARSLRSLIRLQLQQARDGLLGPELDEIENAVKAILMMGSSDTKPSERKLS